MLKTAILIAPYFYKLNDGEERNSDKYKSLKTDIDNSEKWWDGLNWEQRVEVGGVAIHYYKMSANYKWKCKNDDSFNKLTKSQQKIVSFIFSIRNNKYNMLNLVELLKL